MLQATQTPMVDAVATAGVAVVVVGTAHRTVGANQQRLP